VPDRSYLTMKKSTPARRAPRSAKPAASVRPPRNAPSAFPIVGVGASAGGLEAIESFLKNVPASSGMAFVVVQHLDPTHKGLLVELLQRATKMPVVQITDRMKVVPDHVYVIPPSKDLSLLHGVLHLLEPAAPRGLRLPIDFFLRSLADDHHDRAIAVILSGMGSDGTLGIRAIKERSGGVFVQAPASAKFDGMPRSAIDSGLADVVAPVDELPGKIVAYRNHVPLLLRPNGAAHKEQGALEKIIILVRAQTSHDFSHYKKPTIYRRIERRMGLHQLGTIGDYVRYLQENPEEATLLFKELLIGVTSFFRDPAAWNQMRDVALPALVAARPNTPVLRAWTVGCSTGEEAYSLAIVFKEAMDRVRPGRSISLQIFATDLDKDAIDRARQGVYPANIAADVSDERLARFFVQAEHGYRVGKEIREMVIFANQNLVMDPPFTKLDILTCRNLLIYMDPALQQKLFPLFHYSLNPDGILMLGSSESVGTAADFVPLPGKTRLYRRGSDGRSRRVEFPSAFGRSDAATVDRPKTAPTASLQALADRLILQSYAPAVVLTGDKGDILYISGRTGKYLEPVAGRANWNLFAMARPGLSYALNEAFNKAVRLRKPVTIHGGKVGINGGTQIVDVTAEPLTEPDALRGMMLFVFADVAATLETKAAGKARGGVHGARLKAVTQELQATQEELQSTRDEMQISQEELRSSNEELQSTNEELQSTNEELTTSKEEMQSINEELQTVNHELQAKLDELSRANNDMKNLLNSTDIATLFLDDSLNVRRFTAPTTAIIKLIAGDVGRPITDLVTDLDYAELTTDAEEVLRTLVPKERPVSTRDDRWFTVRIMPYRTMDNRIDGLVITFIDITVSKRLERDLRATEAKLRASGT
jgi:two-component system CheB/CheR fusion protein